MRFLVLFATAFAWVAILASADPTPMSQEEFTSAYMSEAAARYPSYSFNHTGPGEISFAPVADDEQVGTIFTDYAYQKYKEDPERLDEIIDHWISSIPIGQEINTEDARNRLVVVLRPSNYLEGLPGEYREEIVHRPFVGDLIAMLMLDSPTALSSATRDLLEENDLSEDEAFIVAEPNTRRLIGDIYRDDLEGIELLESSNGLITALPWLPESCRLGQPSSAMMIVDREFVLRIDEDAGEEATDLFMNISADMISKRESLATGVLMCTDGDWEFVDPNG